MSYKYFVTLVFTSNIRYRYREKACEVTTAGVMITKLPVGLHKCEAITVSLYRVPIWGVVDQDGRSPLTQVDLVYVVDCVDFQKMG